MYAGVGRRSTSRSVGITRITGDDPVGYVVSCNLVRRHLSESQRAMVAARLADMQQGSRTDLSPIGEKSQAETAALLNVGKRSVERAAKVQAEGSDSLIASVDAGEVAVSVAADVAELPKGEQEEVVAIGEAARHPLPTLRYGQEEVRRLKPAPPA